MSRYRNIVVTDYNLDREYNDPKIKFLIGQEEQCPKTGNNHLQMYCEFDRAMTQNQIRKIFGNSHFERRKGNQNQAKLYCEKLDSQIPDGRKVLIGEPSEQGRRKDIEVLNEQAISGVHIHDIVAEHPSSIRFVNNILRIQQFIRPTYRTCLHTKLTRTDFMEQNLGEEVYHYTGSWEAYQMEEIVVLWNAVPKDEQTMMRNILIGIPCHVLTKQGPKVCRITHVLEIIQQASVTIAGASPMLEMTDKYYDEGEHDVFEDEYELPKYPQHSWETDSQYASRVNNKNKKRKL